MNAIFLSNSKDALARVYAPEIIERIRLLTGTDPAFYDKEKVMKKTEVFRDTKYIFSTWGMPEFTQEEIEAVFPALEAIFYAAGSVQAFARPFLNRGVRIFSAWAANAIPVAEYTAAQILLANKGYFQSARLMSEGNPDTAWPLARNYPGNYEARVGIIGTGAIGKLVCAMLKPFHLHVLAYSRSLTEEKARALGAEKSDIDTIFRSCQVVSNHLANNAETRAILTGRHFASMRPYAVFLNTGRGAQVNEAEMIRVLRERPDLTAVLDVTDPEPPLPESPLYQLSNCVLTPHIAGSHGNEVYRMAQWMLEEYERYCSGGKVRYEVTAEMLDSMA